MATKKAAPTATKTAVQTTTPTAAVAPAKLPVVTFPCGQLSILSLLTRPYDREGSMYIGLDELNPNEKLMFTKFIELAGSPINPLDTSKILRVSVGHNAELGIFHLNSISGFSVCRDGNRIVATLGVNTWEVKQVNGESGGATFRVGKLTSQLTPLAAADKEKPPTASVSWRARDEAASSIFEWEEVVVWLQREATPETAPTKISDLRGVTVDGDPLLPLLGHKLVLPEPVWKLAYPNGDDTQEPLEMPLEFNIIGASIKNYTNGTSGPSYVAHLQGAPFNEVAVRLKAAQTIRRMVEDGTQTLEVGEYKLQVFGVRVEDGKHFTEHQIIRGLAINLNDDDENDNDEDEADTETEDDTDALEDEADDGADQGSETEDETDQPDEQETDQEETDQEDERY